MDTAKEDEDMRTALVSVIEADERVKLIKAAIKAGVGFAEIEYFHLKQAQHCKGGKDFSDKRNVNAIKSSMQFKLRDAVADLKNLRKNRLPDSLSKHSDVFTSFWGSFKESRVN